MTTPLDKTIKRALTIRGRAYIIALSPQGLKLTVKGKRNGQELSWNDLVSGDAALAVALNASVGQFSAESAPPLPRAKKVASKKAFRKKRS